MYDIDKKYLREIKKQFEGAFGLKLGRTVESCPAGEWCEFPVKFVDDVSIFQIYRITDRFYLILVKEDRKYYHIIKHKKVLESHGIGFQLLMFDTQICKLSVRRTDLDVEYSRREGQDWKLRDYHMGGSTND